MAKNDVRYLCRYVGRIGKKWQMMSGTYPRTQVRTKVRALNGNTQKKMRYNSENPSLKPILEKNYYQPALYEYITSNDEKTKNCKLMCLFNQGGYVGTYLTFPFSRQFYPGTYSGTRSSWSLQGCKGE